MACSTTRQATVMKSWSLLERLGMITLCHKTGRGAKTQFGGLNRSEEQTSELQSPCNLGCRFLNDTATTEIYTLSLHDALPISWSLLERLGMITLCHKTGRGAKTQFGGLN